MLHQIGQSGVDLLLGDQLIVIQDQHHAVRALCHQIDQGYHLGFEGESVWRLQRL